MKQITHLPNDPEITAGCYHPSGIGYGAFRAVNQDPVTKTIVFDTQRDALNIIHGDAGTTDKIFAIRPDGSGLRQLTEEPSGTRFPGTEGFSVQLPGPYAYSGASCSR